MIAFSPYQVGAARVVIAFLAFLPLFFYFLKKIDWSYFVPFLIIGLFGSALPALLYALAQTKIPSAVAGLLNGLTPIFTLLLAVLFFSRKGSWKHFLGIGLGFTGTCLIFLTKESSGTSFPIIYGLAIVLATMFYGISANTISSKLQGVHPMIISTVSFVIVGPFMLAYLMTTDFLTVIQTHSHGMESLTALMILSLIGTFGANILFFRLIQMTDSVFASSVSFLAPVVALMWGVIDGETISPYFFLALILIFTGVFLVKFKRSA